MNTTNIAQCALEWWRASGPRTLSRLEELIEHYATTNGELANLAHHRKVAFNAVRQWELDKDPRPF